jgi:hypothetical protein
MFLFWGQSREQKIDERFSTPKHRYNLTANLVFLMRRNPQWGIPALELSPARSIAWAESKITSTVLTGTCPVSGWWDYVIALLVFLFSSSFFKFFHLWTCFSTIKSMQSLRQCLWMGYSAALKLSLLSHFKSYFCFSLLFRLVGADSGKYTYSYSVHIRSARNWTRTRSIFLSNLITSPVFKNRVPH